MSKPPAKWRVSGPTKNMFLADKSSTLLLLVVALEQDQLIAFRKSNRVVWWCMAKHILSRALVFQTWRGNWPTPVWFTSAGNRDMEDFDFKESPRLSRRRHTSLRSKSRSLAPKWPFTLYALLDAYCHISQRVLSETGSMYGFNSDSPTPNPP